MPHGIRLPALVVAWLATVLLPLAAQCDEGTEAPPTRVSVEQETDALFPISVNMRWGYIDSTGKVVIEPQFMEPGLFQEGLARVMIGGQRRLRCAYVDTTGKIVIKLDAGQSTRGFSEGFACVGVHDKGMRYGFIDRKGEFVVPPQYRMARDFSEGLAAVRRATDRPPFAWGYIDKMGNMVIEPQFRDAGSFSEGLAFVVVVGVGGFEDNKCGYINVKGEMVIEPQFDQASEYSEGLARVAKDGKWCFIDKTGKVVLQVDYPTVGLFHEGLAPFSLNGKVGYIDTTGKVVIEPKFDNAGDFSEGLAVVTMGARREQIDDEIMVGEHLVGGKDGFIDKTGKIVIEPQFDNAWGFTHGLARVEVGDGFGYINKTGKFVWGPSEDPLDLW